ncbi:MAG TPA: hypothetical protein PLI18_14660, partial [Pirellulaceae bacterium]|nr:hypothetical protein [Pirellulaceae bacterium]
MAKSEKQDHWRSLAEMLGTFITGRPAKGNESQAEESAASVEATPVAPVVPATPVAPVAKTPPATTAPAPAIPAAAPIVEPVLMPVEDESASPVSKWDLLADQLGVAKSRSSSSIPHMVTGWAGESVGGRANEPIDTVRVFGEPPAEDRDQKRLDSMFHTDSRKIPPKPERPEPRRVIDDV